MPENCIQLGRWPTRAGPDVPQPPGADPERRAVHCLSHRLLDTRTDFVSLGRMLVVVNADIVLTPCSGHETVSQGTTGYHGVQHTSIMQKQIDSELLQVQM